MDLGEQLTNVPFLYYPRGCYWVANPHPSRQDAGPHRSVF